MKLPEEWMTRALAWSNARVPVRRWWLLAAGLFVFLVLATGNAHAALPSTLNVGPVTPTPSGRVMTRHADGNDGAAATPLLWGACPAQSTLASASDSFNLRTLCGLVEPGGPLATISLHAGTLPAGCVIADLAGSDGINDGIACTTPTAGSATVTIRATRSAITADVSLSITVATAGTDATAPTIPLAVTATDNADGTGEVAWGPSSDPSVSGIVSGVTSYRVKKDGVTAATVTASSANIQGTLSLTRIGATNGEAVSQNGADWTMTFAGGGLPNNGSDHVLGEFVSVTGDFRATTKVSGWSVTSGTAGSLGLMARSTGAETASYVAARWRDSDDKCNLRYRLTTGGTASNGATSTATYAATSPVWLELTRAGDVLTAACSADGVTFTTSSSQTVSLGSTVLVGPYITSGSAGNTATGTLGQFNVHAGTARLSQPITASGAYTVSAYDGHQYSAESSAASVTITGGTPPPPPPSGGETLPLTVPAATKTMCAAGPPTCDFSPAQLVSIVSSASAASSNGIAAGTVLELRGVTPGVTETWAARLYCNGVSGTSGNPIWVKVRDGDSIMLSMATGATNDPGLLEFNSCNYWNVVGTRDGTTSGLKVADPTAHQTDRNCIHFGKWTGTKCYINRRNIMVRTSTGIAFVGMEINGGDAFQSGFVYAGSSRILMKYVRTGASGSNACDGCASSTAVADGVIATGTAEGAGNFSTGDSDASEGISFCASRSVLQDVYIHHNGHTPMQGCGPYQVWRRITADMNWLDNTDYPIYTGNHAMVMKYTSAKGMGASWDSTLFGPLIENSILINAGSEPEHQEWIETIQLEGYNPIFRGNYIVQRAKSSGMWFGMMAAHMTMPACGMTKDHQWDGSYVYNAHHKIYNNTLWGGSLSSPQGGVYEFTLNGAAYPYSDALGRAVLPEECSDYTITNNLFQGLNVNRTTGKRKAGVSVSSKYTQVAGWIPIGSYTGWANRWKGMRFTDNLVSKHPTDPPADSYFRFNHNTSGGGSLAFDDCSTWPSNFCNDIGSAVWANGLTNPLSGSPSVTASPTIATLADDVRPALTLRGQAGDPGVGDAAPMTYVATADTGSGVTLKLDDARWIYDGWDIDEYNWGGLHTERPDCIAVGATVNATAASATVVGVSAATDIVYTTGTVTLDSGVTRVDGAPVWPATRNSDGSCGAVWDNRGAAQ